LRPKFLADENVNHAIVAGLRRLESGIDILGAHEAGLIGLPDSAVLQIAARTGRVVISHDRNTMIAEFLTVIASTQHPGLLIVKHQRRIGTVIRKILGMREDMAADEFRNTVRHLRISPGD
jgi:Domain of unknown function (DUF5615)